MKIIINEDYFLIQQGTRFDLYWNKPTNKVEIGIDSETGQRTRVVTDKSTTSETNLGYSMKLDYCITKIAHNELDSQKDSVLSLEEWVVEYRNIIENLKKDFSKLLKK